MIKTKIKLSMISDVKEFLDVAFKIECDIDLVKDRYIVDAKSTLGIFTMDLSKPIELVIHSNDESLMELFTKWIVD